MKVRAAVLEDFGHPLAVQEIDLAEPNVGEVLVLGGRPLRVRADGSGS
jgi:Zn-dependent alcohol dehydrogenase